MNVSKEMLHNFFPYLRAYTIRTMHSMVLIAYFLMRGEIVSVSTICILLYPINVSKMCLFHKNNIIFLNKR